jgi:hypothetical protein
MAKVEDLKMEVARLRESLDQFELHKENQSPQTYANLVSTLDTLKNTLENLKIRPEITAITYRMQLHDLAGRITDLYSRINQLKPRLDVPLHKALSLDALYDGFLKAMRFHRTDDSFTIEKSEFTTAVKLARAKALEYYQSQNAQVTLEMDEAGPYIAIERLPA